MPVRVAFTTCAAVPDLSVDDRLLLGPLRDLGFEVVPWIWEAPAPPGLAAVVHRSCWDYHLKPAAFLAWLDALDAASLRALNDGPTVRWNLDKRYLGDLAARGVAIPDTTWIGAGERVDLAVLLRARGLDEVVIKPQISLSAFATSRASRATAGDAQGKLDALTRERAVMVQPFLPEVIEEGELSFVFLGGRHSHTVRKRPRRGDFRVQQEHGGSRERVDAGPARVAVATRILAAAGRPMLYARVDVVETGDGLVLMELEAIDPELFLGFEPGAPERFAAEIAKAIEG